MLQCRKVLLLAYVGMSVVAGCSAGLNHPITSDGDDAGGGSGGGAGGATVCPALTVVPCYSGPPGTEGVGACKAGKQICNAMGEPDGECIGEVLPEPETCRSALIDDDCDGEVDESGADCECGNGVLEEGESCDDGNRLDGDACPATCLRSIKMIKTSDFHACALLTDSRLKCWGSSELYGALGLGDTTIRGDDPGEMGNDLPAIDLGTGKAAVTYATGNCRTCARLNDGTVKCWGAGYSGVPGQGDTMHRGDNPGEMGDNLPTVNLGTGKTAIAISLNENHACVILNDGSVKCWGENKWVQLGLGDTNDRGDQPGEMGDNLPAVDLGTGKTAVAIAAGIDGTCVILNGGSVKCWGYNSFGELGLGDTSHHGDQPGEMGNNLPAVNLGTGKTAVAITMAYHTCALLNDGSVKCWGRNDIGQLGLGDTNNRGDQPGEMGDNLPAVNLGTGKTAVAIGTHSGHTCALLNDGSVKCWGANDFGQLGLGDTNHRGDQPSEMGDNLPAVNLGTIPAISEIVVGGGTCALLNDGRAKCWGWNVLGQLGLGDTNNRGDNPGEMGDNLPFVAP